jgi:hypothetical protein
MKIFSPIAAITLLLIASPALRAQILWSITGPSPYTGTNADIATNGTFVAAVTENYSSLSETVGDTVFDAGSDSHITNIGNGGSDGSDFFPAPAPTAYQEAVNGCSYTYTGNPPVTFKLTGLQTGDLYQVEVWNVVNDSTRDTELSSTGPGGTTSVDFNKDYVLGTFTAGPSGMQSITFQGVLAGGVGEVNAVALRDLGVAPEPSTYAMLFAGIGALVLVSRLRRMA